MCIVIYTACSDFKYLSRHIYLIHIKNCKNVQKVKWSFGNIHNYITLCVNVYNIHIMITHTLAHSNCPFTLENWDHAEPSNHALFRKDTIIIVGFDKVKTKRNI